MKARYLRLTDRAEVPFRSALAEIFEPAPSIPTDAWMSQHGFLRIYDHKPDLLANETHTGYTEEEGPERVDRFWNVGQDLPPAEYQAKLDAEAARLAQIAADAEDVAAARQFARLVALREMRPAGVSGYIANRYTLPVGTIAEVNAFLAKVRDDLETLAIHACVSSKKL